MHAAAHPAITAPPLAPTLGALGDDPRRSLDRLHEMGFRHVQLSATQPGLRPRELDRSARRDLLAIMRRRELEPAGIDLWIPPEHYVDPAHVDRAVSATAAAIEMAADLGRVPVSVVLPRGVDAEAPNPPGDELDEAIASIRAAAHQHGVAVADHAVPVSPRERDEFLGVGIDPAAWLSSSNDPASAVATLANAIVAARACDLSTTGMRAPLGESGGRLDVQAYKVALSVARFERPVVLDARQWSDPWTGIDRSRRVWE